MGQNAKIFSLRSSGARSSVKLLASDDLPARGGRIWTREKLTYLKKYATAFMTAMADKRGPGKWERLVYLDFLCGPGRDIDTETSEEFLGSPLIALSIQPQFDHLYLADKDPKNIKALEKRISSADKERVTLKTGDCNLIIDDVLKLISNRTLGLAFIDPEGFEVDFATLIKLAKRDRCRFDDIESWWKAAAKIVKDGSSLQNADGLEEEPKADGNAQAAAVNEEAV